MFEGEFGIGIVVLVIGAGSIVIGNPVWRVACEFVVLFFNIRDTLSSIKQGKSGG